MCECLNKRKIQQKYKEEIIFFAVGCVSHGQVKANRKCIPRPVNSIKIISFLDFLIKKIL